MTIKQALEPYLEEEEHLWILGRLETALMEMENLDVSTAMCMDIWQRSVKSQRRTRRQGNTTNTTKWGILPKTAGPNNQ